MRIEYANPISRTRLSLSLHCRLRTLLVLRFPIRRHYTNRDVHRIVSQHCSRFLKPKVSVGSQPVCCDWTSSFISPLLLNTATVWSQPSAFVFLSVCVCLCVPAYAFLLLVEDDRGTVREFWPALLPLLVLCA